MNKIYDLYHKNGESCTNVCQTMFTWNAQMYVLSPLFVKWKVLKLYIQGRGIKVYTCQWKVSTENKKIIVIILKTHKVEYAIRSICNVCAVDKFKSPPRWGWKVYREIIRKMFKVNIISCRDKFSVISTLPTNAVHLRVFFEIFDFLRLYWLLCSQF